MVALETVSLFRHLGERDLAALRHIVREKHFSATQEIFHEGATGDGMYAVKSGLVEISTGNAPKRVPLSEVKEGEIFGEMAVVENQPRSANAVAACDTVVWFIPRADLLQLLDKSPALSLSLLREISHRLREFNRHYINEVVQAERMSVIGRFTNSIIHDLKSPLSVIGMATEMLSSPEVPVDRRARATQHIHDQMERINDLITDVLEFTRGSTGPMPLIPLSYAAFVLPVIEELRHDARVKEVQIEFENQPPQRELRLNPRRLRRVFYNLIHNATDAMPNGGKIILRFIPGRTDITTEIEDTGHGIAPEIADNLFKAFATHGKANGTGLGLSISKKIVEDHGGRIWARNEPKHGAIFAFSLPL
ncbi:MAG TPA: ATP-binding protein [Verrucomicrobiae bacterium]|jgi:signal transduction histidine kinase|nr:ATP-binding protein [Verrucomicrobiae bacterium]